MFGTILLKAKLIQLKHISIALEKKFLKSLVTKILLKITAKDIIFEKKIKKLYSERFIFS
jgi:hypothetical protein